jgi:hypothetical protein
MDRIKQKQLNLLLLSTTTFINYFPHYKPRYQNLPWVTQSTCVGHSGLFTVISSSTWYTVVNSFQANPITKRALRTRLGICRAQWAIMAHWAYISISTCNILCKLITLHIVTTSLSLKLSWPDIFLLIHNIYIRSWNYFSREIWFSFMYVTVKNISLGIINM